MALAALDSVQYHRPWALGEGARVPEMGGRFKPYRLVSLQQMLRFYPLRFNQLVDAIGHPQKLKEIAQLVAAQARANAYEPPFYETSKANAPIHFGEGLASILTDLLAICSELELTSAVRQIKRMQLGAASAGYSWRSYDSDLRQLHIRIQEELADCWFMAIPTAKANDYFRKAALFDSLTASVSVSFPSASYDIEHAGTCLAVGQYTACVMHLSRVLEVAVKAYGNLLTVAFASAQPSWGDVLTRTNTAIKERNDKKNLLVTWNSTDEREFCMEAQNTLNHVKTAWRNPSMHAGKKYDGDEAEEILGFVRAFMRHLSQHLDENGNFTP